jgi:hypothetical protein
MAISEPGESNFGCRRTHRVFTSRRFTDLPNIGHPFTN